MKNEEQNIEKQEGNGVLPCVTNRYLIEYNNEFGRNRQTYVDAEDSTQARAIFYNSNHHATIVYTQKV